MEKKKVSHQVDRNEMIIEIMDSGNVQIISEDERNDQYFNLNENGNTQAPNADSPGNNSSMIV